VRPRAVRLRFRLRRREVGRRRVLVLFLVRSSKVHAGCWRCYERAYWHTGIVWESGIEEDASIG
jgi:hypothetical protein